MMFWPVVMMEFTAMNGCKGVGPRPRTPSRFFFICHTNETFVTNVKVCIFTFLPEWMFWFYIVKWNTKWKSYFVKFVQKNIAFASFLFVKKKKCNVFTTRQVWLKLWIVIEPLCFLVLNNKHSVRPLMMPPTQCHWTFLSMEVILSKKTVHLPAFIHWSCFICQGTSWIFTLQLHIYIMIAIKGITAALQWLQCSVIKVTVCYQALGLTVLPLLEVGVVIVKFWSCSGGILLWKAQFSSTGTLIVKFLEVKVEK